MVRESKKKEKYSGQENFNWEGRAKLCMAVEGKNRFWAVFFAKGTYSED